MKFKFLGVLVAMAVLGLSVGDALTGHGIKGNKNLNPMVVGDGSSGSGNPGNSGSNGSSGGATSSSGTGSNNGSSSSDSGNGETEYSFTERDECIFTVNGVTYKGVFYDCKPGKHKCSKACVEEAK
jgi:hypothetical protein